MQTPQPKPARQALSSRLSNWPTAALLLAGALLGVLFWGGFNTALELTNREAFCIGCHEMHDNVYLEYQQTIHYNNRTGVRATCSDCHVPREWGPKMVRKVQASRELWGKITGTINTPEKFEAKRLTLARREWSRMLANDSLECRNCHALESMDPGKQASRAARQHQRALEENITCIVCHQGVAHHLPDGMDDSDDLFNTLQAIAPKTPPHAAIASTPSTAPINAETPSELRDSVGVIDWSRIEPVEIPLFYPGVAHLEWISGDLRIGRDRHGGGWAYRNGETCYACHFDETERMGQRIVSGTKLEPTPILDKAASIPVQLQAALQGDQLHLRFSWKHTGQSTSEPMDADNPIKLAFMLDSGAVEGASRNGCWSSCHADSRSMPDGDIERSKYVKNGSLEDGVFYDLLQWRSGEQRGLDGHVAEVRLMEGGTALLETDGGLSGDTWTVTFVRRLSGGPGDLNLVRGQVYNFGVAIHDAHVNGRFHHVSLGYTLGLDAGALISARSVE